MDSTARELASGAAGLLATVRLWQEAADKCGGNLNARAALLAVLETICGDFQNVDVGYEGLREGRAELARGMAELQDGREKLEADKEAWAGRIRELEARSTDLDIQREELERIAAARAEEGARLDEKSRFIHEPMALIRRQIDDLGVSIGGAVVAAKRGHDQLAGKLHSLTEDQRRLYEESGADRHRRHEELMEGLCLKDGEVEEERRRRDEEAREARRRREEEIKEEQRRRDEEVEERRARDGEMRASRQQYEEERRADNAAFTAGLSVVNDTMAALARTQTALHDEASARMKSLTDDWTAERPRLEREIRELTRARDKALFDLGVCKFELRRSEELTEKQATSLEAMAGMYKRRMGEVDALQEKVDVLLPKAEELDRVRRILVGILGPSDGSSLDPEAVEAISALQMIDSMAKEHLEVTEKADKAEEWKKQAEELAGQVSDARRDDFQEALKRSGGPEEEAEWSGAKRKASTSVQQPGGVSERPPKRLREEWHTRVSQLSLFMHNNMAVPDPDGSVSESRAIHLVLAAVADLRTRLCLDEVLEEAAEGQWYCFDGMLRGRYGESEIGETGCYLHHGSGKREVCYQLRRGVRTDPWGSDSIVCRMRRGPGSS